jgi:hypothetical protein
MRTSKFYIGLIDDVPAYLSFTKDSITCELFRDYKAAKRKFPDVASVKAERVIKVLGVERSEYFELDRKISLLQKQLGELKGSYRVKSIAERFKALWRRSKEWVRLSRPRG